MRRFVFSQLLVFAATALVGGEPLESPPATPKLSRKLAAEIRSSLPNYQAAPETASAEPALQYRPDPDVLVLPKVVIKERAPLRINPDDLLTPSAFDEKLVREYRNSLSGLDAVLNGFSIPLISPSLLARARERHKAQRLDDLNQTINATKAIDPQSAEKMNQAVIEMKKALDWQNR